MPRGPLRIIPQPYSLSLLFGLFVFLFLDKFNESSKNGKAGWEPLYDDISYINDGIQRFSQFQIDPIRTIFDFIVNPPHSPIYTVVAFLSSLLAGADPENTATIVYFLNSLIISGVFFLIFYLIFQKSMRGAMALLVLFIALPSAHFFLYEFRPDLLCSLLIAIALLFRSSCTLKNWYPLVLTLAFLTKPTFALYIFLVYIFLLFIEFYSHSKRQMMRQIKAMLLAHVLQFMPLMVYMVFGGYDLYLYINDAVGPRKSIWDANNRVEGLQLSLGDLYSQIGAFSFILIVVVSLTGISIAALNLDGRILLKVWFGSFLICFVIAFQTLVSTRFFYLPSFVLFFCAGLISWRHAFLKYKLMINPVVLASGISIVAILLALMPNPNPWSSSYMRGPNGNNYQVARIIEAENLHNVMFMFSAAITNDTVKFLLPENRRYSLNTLVLTLDPEKDFTEIVKNLSTYDAVVFAKPEMPGLLSNPPIVFPIHAKQSEFAEALSDAWGLEQKDKVLTNWSFMLLNPKRLESTKVNN